MAGGLSTIKIPDDLASELDKLAGDQRRSAYAIDVLWREVRRNRQREALMLSKGAWKAEDHPELAHGGAAYVDQIRAEPDQRFDSALHPKDR
jgi:hypothetical protein